MAPGSVAGIPSIYLLQMIVFSVICLSAGQVFYEWITVGLSGLALVATTTYWLWESTTPTSLRVPGAIVAIQPTDGRPLDLIMPMRVAVADPAITM